MFLKKKNPVTKACPIRYNQIVGRVYFTTDKPEVHKKLDFDRF